MTSQGGGRGVRGLRARGGDAEVRRSRRESLRAPSVLIPCSLRAHSVLTPCSRYAIYSRRVHTAVSRARAAALMAERQRATLMAGTTEAAEAWEAVRRGAARLRRTWKLSTEERYAFTALRVPEVKGPFVAPLL
jgi:hypothetical protein